jgi:hypothetical protein
MLFEMENQWIHSPIELLHFLSSFDGWNQIFAWELERVQWRGVGWAVLCSLIVKCEEEEVTIVGEQMGIYTQGSNGYVEGDTATLAKSGSRIWNFGG